MKSAIPVIFLDFLHSIAVLIRSLTIKLLGFGEYHIQRILWLTKRPSLPDNDCELYVNLGCGEINHPKFINVDAQTFPHVHYVHSIEFLPMFSDQTVDVIYASHSLEHFRYSEIERVLREWIRVLKPGGVIRLSVPDFDKLLEIYRDTGNPDDIVEQVMGGQNNRYNYHYALFNKKNLSQMLLRVGCGSVCEWEPGSDELTTFNDFSVYKKEVAGRFYDISLNLEAKKN